jgi:predicted metal-dependent hydrolase
MVRFDWSDTPLHWVPGDPLLTVSLDDDHGVPILH